MPYIPEEHKQYSVLPYCREHGGEVFQYHNWPEQQLMELVGEHLIPYGYASYEDYYQTIDGLIQKHVNEPETVSLLNDIKEKIRGWNHKEDWSICKFIGEDIGDVLGVHYGGYYYWPCSAENPHFEGVIDDEEFTAYLYPTDADLWEIVVDPTGMAYRTILEGEDAETSENFDYMMEQVRNLKPEDLHDVKTLGPVPRLNECEVVRVRVISEDATIGLIPGKEYNATVLENSKFLIGDGTGKASSYPAELFEVLTDEE